MSSVRAVFLRRVIARVQLWVEIPLAVRVRVQLWVEIPLAVRVRVIGLRL